MRIIPNPVGIDWEEALIVVVVTVKLDIYTRIKFYLETGFKSSKPPCIIPIEPC
jgi:hypothetical protein